MAGLGVFRGRVVQFDVHRGGGRIKVPHMGWNTLAWDGDFALFAGLGQGASVYFVHGFYAEPEATGNGDGVVGVRTSSPSRRASARASATRTSTRTGT